MSKIAPHICPNCGSPAYEGFSAVECTNQSCDHYHKKTFIEWALEMYAEENEPQVEVDLEVEEPQKFQGLTHWIDTDEETGGAKNTIRDYFDELKEADDDIDEDADTCPGIGTRFDYGA